MGKEQITEAGSENGSGRKRGRPAKVSTRLLDSIAAIHNRAKCSRRHKHNVLKAHHALVILHEDDEGFRADGPYAWLVCNDPVRFIALPPC